MKKYFTFLAAALLSASVFAQSPEKLSYQAVVRDGSNTLVTSTVVGMQISILQGSLSGTAVYVETQNPTTNANGLVSIEIGNGTVVSGNFASIDWASGPYFIKTETDPAGGINYTITGTSQLLSVPYALHAKNAENITGTITETDPIFGVSLASSITAADTANWNNKLDSYTETDPAVAANFDFSGATAGDLLQFNGSKWVKVTPNYLSSETDPVYTAWDKDYADLINTPAPADGSETKINAGTNIAITGSGTTASPYVINTATHYIGENYGGGIVFWVDATGQHGLIAATADQSTALQWYNGSYTTTNAVRNGVNGGMYNTERIVTNQGLGNYAAQICVSYNGSGYGDWYLPSRNELYLLYLQKTVVGGFANAIYWSSTESDTDMAGIVDFGNGSQGSGNKLFSRYVRAIRAF